MLSPVAVLLLAFLTNASSETLRDNPKIRSAGACATATRPEIEQALGQSVGEGKEEILGSGSSCTYSGTYGEVTISIERLINKPDVAAEILTLQAAVPQARVLEKAGMNSPAFVLDIGDSGAQLHVIRNQRDYLMVSILGFGNAARVSSAAEMIARKALARI